MRKLIFTLLFAGIALTGFTQSTVVFQEDFEIVPAPGVSSTAGCFDVNTRVQAGGLNSDSTGLSPGGVCILETNPFDTQNLFNVYLTFSHICKIEFFDKATIEVSNDGGFTWNQLIDNAGGPSNNCNYIGSGLFRTQGSEFDEASYPVDWQPGVSILPDNNWWRTEQFDISLLAGGFPDVRIRFVVTDLDNNGLGTLSGKGWFIDDILVEASFCELIPPHMTSPTVYSGGVFFTGPYPVTATATDASGVAGVLMNWTLNGTPQPFVLMGFVADSTYTGQIPAVNDSDVVCYQFQAIDNSFCSNLASWPDPNDPNVYQCFTAYAGISLPYCDNFELPNQLWNAKNLSATATTVWEKGTPTNPPTNTTHSGTQAWDTDLDANYVNNANCALISPGFGGLIAGTKLSFWQNFNTENGWDGTRLEWATDTIPGTTWNMLGAVGCPTCVNWYTDNALNSSNLPAWEGTSNGWIESSIELDATFNGLPQVFFRFVFTSDGSVIGSGHTIDDFCLALPQPDDAGVLSINTPGNTSPAGTSVSPQVTIKNFGINTQSVIDVEYTIDSGSGPVVTGSGQYVGSLAAGQTANLTLTPFTVPVDNFTICAYTQLPGDGNNYNDTTCRSSFGVPVLAVSSCDDFETGSLGWYDSSTNAASMAWELGAPNFGNTTGAYSGTNAWDINLVGPYGANTTATLNSVIYDISGTTNPYLSFWRNQNTGYSDAFRVYYDLNNSGTWQLLGLYNDPFAFQWYNNPSPNGNPNAGFWGNSSGWVQSRYYLQNIVGGANFIQFRLVFQSGNNIQPAEGVSIDDFCVLQPDVCDLAVEAIDEPAATAPAGDPSNISVTVRNIGTTTQSNFQITAIVNPGAITVGPFLVTASLAPGATNSYNIGTFNIPNGAYTVTAYTTLGCDVTNDNDTLSIDRNGSPIIPLSYTTPYCDDFEGPNAGWYNELIPFEDPNTIWEYGNPNFGATVGAHSGTNAWDINLNTGYTNNAGTMLYSPYFDITGAADPMVNWWHQWREEANWDGVRMEYELNANNTWSILGGFGPPFNPPNWIGWYNDDLINSSGLPAWTNTGGGWVNSQANDLSFMNGSTRVRFRYIFTSDGAVIQDGHTIDDWCLIIPVPLTAAPINVLTNTINSSFIFPGQQVEFSSFISNPGTTALDSVDVQVLINGNVFTSEKILYPTQLAPGTSLLHTFLQNWQAAPGVYDICVVTSNPNGLPDLNPTDDTTCITISVFDSVTVNSTNPYCTDFESGPQWVSVNALTYNNTAGNDWQLGTPSQTIMNGARSGVNAWMIDIDENYQNRDSSGLFTPVFSVEQGQCYKLSFWHKYDTELWADGGTVEFSTDNAQTWNHLGFASSQPQPWFNSSFITALGGNPGLPGWSGTQATWTQAEHDVTFYSTGTVIFRFRFASDNSVNNYEGWVIDDFCFEQIAGPCVVGIEDPILSQLMLGQNNPNPVNGNTTIKFNLPEAGDTKLTITDLLGQEVATVFNQNFSAGAHSIDVNVSTLPAGIYYYTLDFEGQKMTRKMVVTQ